jgi:hypothetical protein
MATDDPPVPEDDELDPNVTAADSAELQAEEAGHQRPNPEGMSDEELSEVVEELPDPPEAAD